MMDLEGAAPESRVLMSKGRQRKIIESSKKKSGLSWNLLSKKVGATESMIRNNYRYERYLLPLGMLRKICEVGGIGPEEWEKRVIEIRPRHWGRVLGGKSAGKLRWRGGPKIKIRLPEKSENLAEFVGIILGDGSVGKTNYATEIFLNRDLDLHYSVYVKDLCWRLFGTVPHEIRPKGSKVIKIRINSKSLYEFIKYLGLPTDGSVKHIPVWALRDRAMSRSVLRGLFDTDGSIFMSSRRSVLNFCSSSEKMISQVRDALERDGIKTYLNGKNLNISSVGGIKRFMSLIGTSNLKNAVKFIEYTENGGTIRSKQVVAAAEKHRDVRMPYRMHPE